MTVHSGPIIVFDAMCVLCSANVALCCGTTAAGDSG
jgi:hypothetical protein